MTRTTAFRRAHGFVLIELMVAMAIFTAMVTYGLYLQNLGAQGEQGRKAGQLYAAINRAVGNYMVAHYAALEKLHDGCSTTTFREGTSGTFDSSLDCSLLISSAVNVQPEVRMVNGLQPTVAELITAGYLPRDKAGVVPGVPSLPMDSVVAEANASTGAASSTKAVGRLFINIERVCLATHTADPGSVSAPQGPDPSTGYCYPKTTTSFSSLVFNTQPYTYNNTNQTAFASRLDGLWTAIGSDVAMSNFISGGELKGSNFLITNPVVSATKVGMAGIVAVRNGYGATYAKNHARVDGSNPPTSDWSFANNSISDVGKLTAKSVDALTVDASVVYADVVKAQVLKLGDRVEGDACDASKENVSYGSQTILMCQSGKWAALGAKGAVNGREYYEFVLNKSKGDYMKLSLTHCPKSGCAVGYSYSNTDPVELITDLNKDEWQPVMVRVKDEPNGIYGVMRSNYGFEVNGYGNYKFTFYHGGGLWTNIFGLEVAYFTIRFYRINP